MRSLSFAAACILIAGAGCSKANQPPASNVTGTNKLEEPSGVIGTMLQYDTLKAGRKAQDKARQAAQSHNNRLRDAMPENQ